MLSQEFSAVFEVEALDLFEKQLLVRLFQQGLELLFAGGGEAQLGLELLDSLFQEFVLFGGDCGVGEEYCVDWGGGFYYLGFQVLEFFVFVCDPFVVFVSDGFDRYFRFMELCFQFIIG